MLAHREIAEAMGDRAFEAPKDHKEDLVPKEIQDHKVPQDCLAHKDDPGHRDLLEFLDKGIFLELLARKDPT